MYYSLRERLLGLLLGSIWLAAGAFFLRIITQEPSASYFFVSSSYAIMFLFLSLMFGFFHALFFLVFASGIVLYFALAARNYTILLSIPFMVLCSLPASFYKRTKDAKLNSQRLSTDKLTEFLNLNHNKKGKLLLTKVALKEKKAKYTSLTEILKFFSKKLTRQEIIDYLSTAIPKVLPNYNILCFYMLNRKDHNLELRKAAFNSIEPYKLKMKKGDEFDNWIFKHKQPLIVNDASKDFRFDSSAVMGLPEDHRSLSLISTPLIHANNFLGIIRLNSMRPETYNFEDLRLLNIIGDLCAVALKNADLYEQTQHLAIIDDLSGLYKHNYFIEKSEEEISRCMRANIAYGMIFFDIDNFKEYNDEYGHIAGDIVLRNVAKIIRENLPAGALAARYGGEEFACLCSGISAQSLKETADKIRKSVESFNFVLRRKLTKVTVSGGITFCAETKLGTKDIIAQADAMLYKAKNEGKNKICG